MNSVLYEKVQNLKNIIENDENVLKVKELDKKLNSSDEVMRLAYKKDVALSEYETALNHFKTDSGEVKKAQKELYQAKLALDSHPLVKEYNQYFAKVRLMYKRINDEIFGEFVKKGVRDCD